MGGPFGLRNYEMCEPRESRGAERRGAFPEGKFENLLCEPAESAGGQGPFCVSKIRELAVPLPRS
ncbi:MAG: hypothetical protein HFE62_03410 [Firmicutes bacterium]|nr:hypothetical protein [Bacillota bacterium]